MLIIVKIILGSWILLLPEVNLTVLLILALATKLHGKAPVGSR